MHIMLNNTITSLYGCDITMNNMRHHDYVFKAVEMLPVDIMMHTAVKSQFVIVASQWIL